MCYLYHNRAIHWWEIKCKLIQSYCFRFKYKAINYSRMHNGQVLMAIVGRNNTFCGINLNAQPRKKISALCYSGRDRGEKQKSWWWVREERETEGSEEKAESYRDHPWSRIIPSKIRWAIPCHAFFRNDAKYGGEGAEVARGGKNDRWDFRLSAP